MAKESPLYVIIAAFIIGVALAAYESPLRPAGYWIIVVGIVLLAAYAFSMTRSDSGRV